MEHTNLHKRYTFYELKDLLGIRPNSRSVVHSELVKGDVTSYYIECGLHASLWNCHIIDDITFSNVGEYKHNPYLTFAYFQDPGVIKLINCITQTEYTTVWDYILFSDTADYLLKIPADTAVRCVIVNVSRKWLCHELNGNVRLSKLKQEICETPKLFLLGVISNAEKDNINTLLQMSVEEELRPFYIKSEVLKLLTDLIHHLSDQNSQDMNNSFQNLASVEEYLCSKIRGKMPDLKKLAAMFNFSQSSLTRKFKEKNGMTMSSYYLSKKMHYARKLMNNKNSILEVAQQLGYRNSKKFLAMYKRLT